MGGELDLNTLLATLSADLVEDTFVFVTTTAPVPDGLTPKMRFTEAEGETLIVTQTQAEAHGLAYEFPCRMITLNVHSALEAVGFIAHVATRLAEAGMGVNPVAGFYHDHLFVPQGRAADALTILEQIKTEAAAQA